MACARCKQFLEVIIALQRTIDDTLAALAPGVGKHPELLKEYEQACANSRQSWDQIDKKRKEIEAED